MNALRMRHSPGTPAHRFAMVLIAAGALSACASGPKVPDWKIQSIGHVERFTAAYLKGDSRVEAREFDLARAETAGTGRPDLVARIELNRCAALGGRRPAQCAANSRRRAASQSSSRATSIGRQ